MTIQRNRTNLTLSDDLHKTICDASKALGVSRAKLITNLLKELQPSLDRTAHAITELKKETTDPTAVLNALGVETFTEIMEQSQGVLLAIQDMKKDD